jgi:hypothetical protein
MARLLPTSVEAHGFATYNDSIIPAITSHVNSMAVGASVP